MCHERKDGTIERIVVEPSDILSISYHGSSTVCNCFYGIGPLEVISGMCKNMIRKMIRDALFFSELRKLYYPLEREETQGL